jgi:uncharacterized protein (TIGR02687 family)
MLQEKVQEHFKNPLNSKVLIYFDKSGAYKEEVENWELSYIELLVGDGRYFYLKTRLHLELKGEKVFLYFPFPKPTGKDWEAFPMLSVYHSNTELLMDEHGQFVESHGLKPNQLPLVKKYFSVLSLKNAQKVMAKVLTAENFTEANLKRGLVAYYLEMSTVTDPTLCLVRLMTLHDKPKLLQKALKKIQSTDLESTVLEWVHKYFGMRMPSGLSLDSIQQLAEKTKYNVIIGTISAAVTADNYQQLRIKDTIVRNLFDTFWVDWKNSTYSSLIDTVFEVTARNIQADKLIKWYGIEHSYGYYTEAMSIAVLKQSFEQVEHQPEKVRNNLSNWMNQTSALSYELHFKALKDIATVLMLLSKAEKYRYNTLDAYIEAYTSHWYKVDLHYRKAMMYYESLSVNPDVFEEYFESLLPLLHLQYDRFLVELNVEWLTLLKEQSFDYAKIKTPKQFDFYASNIANLEYKSVVIISDGLRYEAGKALYEVLLQSDDKVTVNIAPMLASIPSYTKLGMSNLLPNKGMTVQQNSTGTDLEFSINGVSTEGLKNRLQILRQTNPKANVEAYTDIIKLNQQQGRDTFKAHPLTFIYHNQIDVVSDNVKSEENTFRAVEQTIDDLLKLINKLRDSWNVYYIYIISDHGFLYNHQTISEASKEEMPKDEDVWSKHSRFLLSDKDYDYKEGYSFPLRNTTNLDSDIQVHLPYAINRFRRQGSGKQYVHGGGSLQELVIPSIAYFKKRDDSDLEYVNVIIVNKDNLKITSNALKLEFLQEHAVSNDYKKTIWVVGLYTKDNELLSNEEVVVFDKTSDNPIERMQRVLLKFGSTGSESTFCFVKVFDGNDKTQNRLNPLFEKRLHNNSLMGLDF